MFITPNSKHRVFVPRKLYPFTIKQINKSLTWPFYYGRRQSATTFYRFKLAVTRIQINLGDSCQLTRNSFKYSFLSQCFSGDTNLSYFMTDSALDTVLNRFVSKEIHARSSRSALFRVSLYGQKLEEWFSLVGNNRQHSFQTYRGS